MPLLLPESPGGDLVARQCAREPRGRSARASWRDGGSPTRPPPAVRSPPCRSAATSYAPGDTDLSWTRITPWRALLAAALDQRHGGIVGATVEAERAQRQRRPAGRLAVPAAEGTSSSVEASEGPGITAARLHTDDGRHRHHPGRRSAGEVLHPRPARAPRGAEAARDVRAAGRGAAAAGPHDIYALRRVEETRPPSHRKRPRPAAPGNGSTSGTRPPKEPVGDERR